jgi:hypothetical protein
MSINNLDPNSQPSLCEVKNEKVIIGLVKSVTTEGEHIDWDNLLSVDCIGERRPYQRYMKQH